MRPRLLALVALCALLVACVDDNRPDDEACAAPSITLDVTLTEESLTPTDPAVCRGQEVTLSVTPEVDGVLHIHGYDAAVPATEVRDGQAVQLEFTADRSGQFPIELHTAEDSQGVSVGVFTVHEP